MWFRTENDALQALPRIAAHLANGGIIAYPTETVYGFGCYLQHAPLQELSQIKGRDATKPFLLLSSDPMSLPGINWTDSARVLARKFWPGALTIALKADEARYQPPVLSLDKTVAIRQTPHPALRLLLEGLQQPITSTSANLPGGSPATSSDEVVELLDRHGLSHVMVLAGGAIAPSPPSTVVDCAGAVPRVVRAGAIATDTLRAALSDEGFSIDG